MKLKELKKYRIKNLYEILGGTGTLTGGNPARGANDPNAGVAN